MSHTRMFRPEKGPCPIPTSIEDITVTMNRVVEGVKVTAIDKSL